MKKPSPTPAQDETTAVNLEVESTEPSLSRSATTSATTGMRTGGRPTVQEIVSRLRLVRRSGDGFSAACPVHDDTSPSLSVHTGRDGRPLVFCHRCSLDMTQDDFFEAFRDAISDRPVNPDVAAKVSSYRAKPKEDDRERRVLRKHFYLDDACQPAYLHQRIELVDRSTGEVTKSFLWKHNANVDKPDLHPAWMPGLNGSKPGLYGAHEVTDDLPEMALTEGEKDADALRKVGVPALSVPDGAGYRLTDRDIDVLRHAGLVIVTQDNDDAGREHAQRVAQTLRGSGVNVVIKAPPEPHNDVADALAAGIEWRDFVGVSITEPTTTTTTQQASTTRPPSQLQGSLAHRMVTHVRDTHRLFVGDDGRSYMVRSDGGRLAELITSSAVIRECLNMAGTSSLASPAKDAAVVLKALAADSPPVNLSLRVAGHCGGLVLDLGQRGNVKCVHVTAEGWKVLESPPEGVLFRRSRVTQPLPEPVPGGSLDPLKSILDLEEEQWKLVQGWLAASLLPTVPRPMLAFLGVQGSAKTTRAAMVCGIYDPKPEHALGSSFAKSLSDDRIKALSHYLLSYDNLTNISREASDHLARMVTGDSADARQLYTDGELFTVTYKRTGLFTAITLPPLQPDARERVIPITLKRVPEHKRRSEEELWEEFQAAWPGTLGAVLDLAVRMLANLPTVRANTTAKPRMADYYLALKAVDPDLADAYWAAVDDSMREAAEDDPFVAVVVKWLDDEWSDPRNKDKDLTFTPTEAWRKAGHYRDPETTELRGGGARWWPNSARLFSAAITRAAEPLRALGIVAESGRSNGRRVLRFHKMAETGTQTGSMNLEQGR